MKKYIIIICCVMTTCVFSQGEVYYIGAGDTDGVKVSGSVNGHGTKPQNTINGSGLDAEYMEASRLLAQASIGYTEGHVEEVMEVGIEEWIDQQMEMPQSELLKNIYSINEKREKNLLNNIDRELFESELYDFRSPRLIPFEYSWWDINMNNEDLLRHKMAYALSQIFVISSQSELAEDGDGLAQYYDILGANAFGNFRDLLYDVTVHPCMGFFLSHLNNPKSDPINNISPDENYAREIMQLFTIGLYELNLDGSRKKDATGNDIPTYDQSDIKELAKIFTGLGGAEFSRDHLDYFERNNMNPGNISFGVDPYAVSFVHPMKMYEEWHERGEKIIVGDKRIPNGQSGMKDLNMALDILFNHDNVGPFISRRLIQRLVKSNPSSQYIERISKVFNNNGGGVRGDLRAVVKAILMDEEARSCEWQQDMTSGMLREPFIRQHQFTRSIEKFENEFGYYSFSYSNNTMLKQNILGSPSVFNFYLPDYSPVGELDELGLAAPEFQIHDTHTAIGYINMFHTFTFYETLTGDSERYPEEWERKVVKPDFRRFDEFNSDFESLINHIDKFYVHGRLSDPMRNIVREAIFPMKNWNYKYRDHIKAALNLILISPDYTILK